ncbi:uncharacterized protein LOC143276635 [Babylonia areolata]|uniref:uncharacterized protein LOC143276635 n=1 Tax=Babylonia areolata TaxID=304850 RepID=UPI003FD44E9E
MRRANEELLCRGGPVTGRPKSRDLPDKPPPMGSVRRQIAATLPSKSELSQVKSSDNIVPSKSELSQINKSELSQVKSSDNIVPSKSELSQVKSSDNIVPSKSELSQIKSSDNIVPSKSELSQIKSSDNIVPSKSELSQIKSSDNIVPSKSELSQVKSSDNIVPSKSELSQVKSSDNIVPSKSELSQVKSSDKIVPRKSKLSHVKSSDKIVPRKSKLSQIKSSDNIVSCRIYITASEKVSLILRSETKLGSTVLSAAGELTIPSAPLVFRATCGSFVPVFLAFMLKRARQKAAMRVAILSLRGRTDGVTLGLLLTLIFWGGLLLKCGDVEQNPGPGLDHSDQTA